jgi:GT2 family glycosyltransferase
VDQHRAVARAIWIEPAITDPQAAPLRDPPAGPYTIPAPQQPSAPPPWASRVPLISVLTPVHDPPLHMLEEAIASVREQTFTNWELCLVDDGSSNPEIITALQRHAASDPRIHLTRRETPGGISTATNTALELATGHYIALLDHDDTLSPDALKHVADQITTQPDLDMIYSDEDILLDGRQIWVHLKPGWSPDTLRTNGYTCHLGVYRRALVSEIGGFRTEFNGSQDVDMILRLVERTDRIAHIPRILYHWRAHASSTAGGDAKPYAYVAARNAIAGHLLRTGVEGEVGYGPPGLYRVAHRVSPSTTVDLVLAVVDEQGLSEAAASWLSQPHPTWNVVLAAPAHTLDAVTAALTIAGIASSRITTIATEPGERLASALGAAAGAATAEHLLIMQTPAIGVTHDWLTRLVGYSQQPKIAAAGPILLAPDGRIQQAGIAIPDGIPLHLLHGIRSSMDNLFGFGTSVYNVSAVSGALATRRDTYQELGGLNPKLADLALIDYCLRATDTRQRIVIVPDARLRTTGPDITTNDLPTIWQLRHNWAQTHTHDPYYNPNYRTDRGDFERIRS